MADDSAKIRIEAGQTSNAKPIYCHPVRFDVNGSSGGQSILVKRGSVLILTNDGTPFTTTSLMSFLYEHRETMDISCCVDFYDDQNAYAGQILRINAGESNFQLEYTKDGATTATLYLSPTTEFTVTDDKANKIN